MITGGGDGSGNGQNKIIMLNLIKCFHFISKKNVLDFWHTSYFFKSIFRGFFWASQQYLI